MRNFFTTLIAILFSVQLLAQIPTISSFSPAAGPVGATVMISGNNFDSIPSNNLVYFGAVKAMIFSATSTLLSAIVPAGATYQPITITTGGLTAFSTKPFMVTFGGGGVAFSSTSLLEKTDYPVGIGPTCTASGDLDGDGKSELITITVAPNVVSIFRNESVTGNISFASKVDFMTGSNPNCITIGDLDGDGKLDLAVTNGNSYTVSLFRNTSTGVGNISFAEKVDLQAGNLPFGLVITDLNGDGKPDVLAANFNSNNVSTFKNLSTPGLIAFALKYDISMGNSPVWLAAGDLDNDGKIDIAVATGGNSVNSVSVLRNTSTLENISFETKIDIDAGGKSFGIAMGDLDGDGKMDITVAADATPSVVVLQNTSVAEGVISFAPKTTFFTNDGSYGVTLCDIDGDGKTDILSVNSNANSISVLNNSSISGTISFNTKTDFIVGTSPWTSSATDFDGDGKPDIATANYMSSNISILKNLLGESSYIKLCPPVGSSVITSNIAGLSYQWQEDTGNGFTNIFNNTNYSGSATNTLQLINIPSSWQGYKYRCIVDINTSDIFELQFSDTWTGAVSSAWENSANWSCGSLPDANTDVVINSGTVIINSNITIRSLKVNPGASITVNSGFTLTILH